MKKILIGLAALVAVAGIAVFVLVGNLDKIIKAALEGVGSELLGVQVTVERVELDMKNGAGQISGFTIANPPGYSAQNAFQMDKIRLGLNLGSLGKQPLVIDELTITSPVVELEAKEDGSSNLQTLLDNIEKNSAQANQKATEQQPKSKDAPAGEPVRLSFKTLSITGVSVNALVAGAEPQKVAIPDIAMKNVGGEQGLTPAEVGHVIIGDIIAKSLKAALKKEMTERAEEAGKGLLEDLKNKLTP